MPTQTLTPTQKVAALLVTLGPERAEEVLGHLDPAQAARIGKEILAMSRLSPEAVRAVTREFRVLATRPSLSAAPLLTRVTAEHAVTLLADEPLPIAALLLMSLPDEPRHAILAAFPEETRGRLLVHLARTTPPAPDAAAHLEHAVRAKAERLHIEESVQAEVLIDALRAPERPAPVAPQPRPDFSFHALAALDIAILREVLARTEVNDLTQALRGAEEALCQRVLRALPLRRRAQVRHALASDTPIRLREITAAQERIAALARRLLREMQPNPAREEAVYA